MEFKIGFHHGRRGQLSYKHPIYIHPSVYIDNTEDVIIGKGVSLSRHVRIYTHDHFHDGQTTIEEDVKSNNVKLNGGIIIGDNVYIGDGVIILASCQKIGSNSVIGAGSVVTEDVPKNEVWAGNPARFIRDINERQEKTQQIDFSDGKCHTPGDPADL